jgi:class 3 adenylate cyclase
VEKRGGEEVNARRPELSRRIAQGENGAEREVVILMTDMVQYAQHSAGMSPEQIRDFLTVYHGGIIDLILLAESRPVEVDPFAGDGSLVIFDKRPDEDCRGICTRALAAALRLSQAIVDGRLAPTRIGIFLGRIIEARLGNRLSKFGASFSVANRLEELCGYFGTELLMDREVARNQQGYGEWLVNIAKISLASFLHPMNIYTLYCPGANGIPAAVDQRGLRQFIAMKNAAMEFFTGNQLLEVSPDFPRAREELLQAQRHFRGLLGRDDIATERILEYIREMPLPTAEFSQCGMQLLEKKRNSLGDRLFHLSKQLLRAMNPDYYQALVVDTEWEQYFKLEWRKKGETIVEFGSLPDGIYYLDSGTVETFNAKGALLSTMAEGTIFGEMAYFGKEQRRTATVRAKTDVVLRRITTGDFEKLPVIQSIFKQIASARTREFADRRSDKRGSRPVPSLE